MRLHTEAFVKVEMPFMQAVHEEEIGMLNVLFAMLEEAEAGRAVSDQLTIGIDAFQAHLVTHFAGEEERMQACGFPPFEIHKGEHDRLLAEISSVIEQWKQDEVLEPLAAWLRHDLPAWMQQHIATMDSVTAHFLSMHGSEDQ